MRIQSRSQSSITTEELERIRLLMKDPKDSKDDKDRFFPVFDVLAVPIILAVLALAFCIFQGRPVPPFPSRSTSLLKESLSSQWRGDRGLGEAVFS